MSNEENAFNGNHNIGAMARFLEGLNSYNYKLDWLFGEFNLVSIKECCIKHVTLHDGHGNTVGSRIEADTAVLTILTVFYINGTTNGTVSSWFDLFQSINEIDNEILNNGHGFPVYEIYNLYLLLKDWSKEELDTIKSIDFIIGDELVSLIDYKSKIDRIRTLEECFKDTNIEEFKLNNCSIANRTESPLNVLHTVSYVNHRYGERLSLMMIADSLLWTKKGKFVSNIKTDEGVIKFEFFQDNIEDASYVDFTKEVKELLTDYLEELKEYEQSLIKGVQRWYDEPITELLPLVKYLKEKQDRGNKNGTEI